MSPNGSSVGPSDEIFSQDLEVGKCNKWTLEVTHSFKYSGKNPWKKLWKKHAMSPACFCTNLFSAPVELFVMRKPRHKMWIPTREHAGEAK